MFPSDITALIFSRITALFGIGISATTIPPLQKMIFSSKVKITNTPLRDLMI